jgi:hypothetical protein
VTWPEPQPGLVIRYSYLWRREASEGRTEGVKDRPCAVVLVVQAAEGERPRVIVLPISHASPHRPEDAVELPLVTKERLGLDGERSWVVVSEANEFRWPGPDLRLVPGRGPESTAYGFLPPALFRQIRDRFIARVRARQAGGTRRTE